MSQSASNTPTNKNNDSFLSDLTDGREKGNWKSRYVEEAQIAIKWEKKYLLFVFFFALLISLLSGFFFKGCLFNIGCNLGDFKIYLFALFGGLLGGTIFSMKWLVHSVAKDTWNIDRRLWRIFTPLVSSVVALLIVILINSDFIKGDANKCISIYKSFGIGFLSGYFSDNAIGKLTEIAQVLFGSASKGK